MSDTTIRVSEEAKNRLDALKREEESYNDVIIRLSGQDKWAGFGRFAEDGDEIREGMTEIREQMRGQMAEDIAGADEQC